jgi:outer membrane protein OmpA-like peptidoglycan-associated protein
MSLLHTSLVRLSSLLALAVGLSLSATAMAQTVPVVVDQSKPKAVESYNPEAASPDKAGWPWNVQLKGDDWGIGAKAREKYEKAFPQRQPAALAPLPAPQATAPLRAPAIEAEKKSISGSEIAEGLRSTLEQAGAPRARPLFAPAAAAPQLQAFDASGQCFEQRVSWVKKCTAVGYPTDFVGEVKGETSVVCPKGELRDAWLTNSCSPPGGATNQATTGDILPAAVMPANTAQSVGMVRVGDDGTQVISPASNEKLDGRCGIANGAIASSMPSIGLCDAGVSSDVSGQGPWRWTCAGQNGGMSISCAAMVAGDLSGNQSSVAGIDGICGAAHNAGATTAPGENLCASGIAGTVSGQGPWFWACAGVNGGKAMSCQAAVKMDGACGAAHAVGSKDRPASGLCLRGNAGPVMGTGPWNWACNGEFGGAIAQCSANVSADGQCGVAAQRGMREQPIDGLCNIGQASAVTGTGPWRWTCSGAEGGQPANCTAALSADGSCGAASGRPANLQPANDLCAAGMPSTVNGAGPWDWNCAGQDGGVTVSCTAPFTAVAADTAPVLEPMPSRADNALESGTTADAMPTVSASEEPLHAEEAVADSLRDQAPVPDAAPTTAVTTEKSAPPVAKAASVSLCGKAADIATIKAPSGDLCSAGQASAVSGDGPWSWTCTVKDTGQTNNCTATVPVLAECGSANGISVGVLPSDNLCAQGTTRNISGDGPWSWLCDGGAGGMNAECSAPYDASKKPKDVAKAEPKVAPKVEAKPGDIVGTAQTLAVPPEMQAAQQPVATVDGLCGKSSGVASKQAPSADLCAKGAASQVAGTGPWTWSCAGVNGGLAAACLAPTAAVVGKVVPSTGSVVNGLCGKLDGVALAAAPTADLCSFGSPTQVAGSGPWTWSCAGVDGGTTANCVALNSAMTLGTLTVPADNPVATMANAEQLAVATAAPALAVAPQAGTLTTPRLDTAAMPTIPAIPTPAPATDQQLQLPVAAQADVPSLAPLPPVGAVDVPLPKIAANTNIIAPGVNNYAPSPPVRSDALPPAPMRSGETQAAATATGLKPMALDPGLSMVEFEDKSDQLSEEAATIVNQVADFLRSGGGNRIQLTAYADNDGISTREARRISLARALSVRDVLVRRGIDAGRIDVRAMGANVPSGEPDRVDFVIN